MSASSISSSPKPLIFPLHGRRPCRVFRFNIEFVRSRWAWRPTVLWCNIAVFLISCLLLERGRRSGSVPLLVPSETRITSVTSALRAAPVLESSVFFFTKSSGDLHSALEVPQKTPAKRQSLLSFRAATPGGSRLQVLRGCLCPRL